MQFETRSHEVGRTRSAIRTSATALWEALAYNTASQHRADLQAHELLQELVAAFQHCIAG
jgi:hypothetical protein